MCGADPSSPAGGIALVTRMAPDGLRTSRRIGLGRSRHRALVWARDERRDLSQWITHSADCVSLAACQYDRVNRVSGSACAAGHVDHQHRFVAGDAARLSGLEVLGRAS